MVGISVSVWITGFDSMIQDVNPGDLTVIGSIDMSSNSKLFWKFVDKYGKGDYSELCFDEENRTVYYNW